MSTAIGDGDVERIKELDAEGLGRKAISDYLGLTEYTVKAVLAGKVPSVTDNLSVRQRGRLINQAFPGPPRGRIA